MANAYAQGLNDCTAKRTAKSQRFQVGAKNVEARSSGNVHRKLVPDSGALNRKSTGAHGSEMAARNDNCMHEAERRLKCATLQLNSLVIPPSLITRSSTFTIQLLN
jgi:hypothetical protein